jgi:hypothetical protein
MSSPMATLNKLGRMSVLNLPSMLTASKTPSKRFKLVACGTVAIFMVHAYLIASAEDVEDHTRDSAANSGA